MLRNLLSTLVLLSSLIVLVKAQTWSEWSGWSNSTLKCVEERSRRCLDDRNKLSSPYMLCKGDDVEYRQQCAKPCALDTWSVKALQCSRYNYMLKGGSYQEWIPVPHHDKLSPIDLDPCQLICQMVNTYYYHNFGFVDDGTLCGTKDSRSLRICLRGKCTKIRKNNYPKCKPKTVTQCKKCKGTGCVKHKNVYFWNNLSRYKRGEEPALGYHQLMTLPQKACGINVHDRSPNFISINAHEEGILNHNWVVNPTGLYKGAGTVWAYQRGRMLETLSAKGPLTTEVEIMVLARSYEDVGVSVEYCLPDLDKGKKKKKKKKICRKCKPVKRGVRNYCQSDFVTRARILGVEIVGKSSRYEVSIIQSFKNTIPLISREYIWTNNTCRCPDLKKDQEYLLMGKVDNNYQGNELRLVVGPKNFVRKYSTGVARRIMHIQFKEHEFCRDANKLPFRFSR